MNKKLFAFGVISVIALSSVISFNANQSKLLETTKDFNENIGLTLKEANIGESEEISVSKTYVQYGSVGTRQFLRFATAVTGPAKTIKYTRTVEGVGTQEKEVTTVYKGISAGESVYYYNGTDITTTSDENTDKYYWACYTIEFATDTYKASDIQAYLTVEGYEEESVVSETKETSFVEQVEALEVQGIYTIGELDIIRANLAKGYDYQGKTFKLMADLNLGKLGSDYIVVNNTTFVLDLNGHSITGNSDASNSALIRVNKNGKLIIEDSSSEQTGKLSYSYSGTKQWEANYTVSGENYGATIIVNGGTIENTSGDAVIASAIDTKNYGSSVNKVIVNGGVISCPTQYGIRMYCNSTTTWNEVEINGGQIHGRRGIWLQNPNTPNQHALGRLTVNGGTITGVQNIIRASRDGACTTEECETIHYEINLNNDLTASDVTFSGGAEEHTIINAKTEGVSTFEELKEALKTEKEIKIKGMIKLESGINASDVKFVGIDENSGIDFDSNIIGGGNTISYENLYLKTRTTTDGSSDIPAGTFYGGIDYGTHTIANYTNCTIEGVFTTYSDTINAVNCEFKSYVEGSEEFYNVFGYTGGTINLTDCTFYYRDRALKIYSEGPANFELNLINPTFVATEDYILNKALINIDTTYLTTCVVNIENINIDEKLASLKVCSYSDASKVTVNVK